MAANVLWSWAGQFGRGSWAGQSQPRVCNHVAGSYIPNKLYVYMTIGAWKKMRPVAARDAR